MGWRGFRRPELIRDQLLREGHRVVKKFFRFEEAIEFDGGILKTVGSMGDVLHHRYTEVAADGSLGSLGRICWTEEVANTFYGIFTRDRESDEGCGLHEILDLGEEGFRGNVSVVLLQQARIGPEHLAPADLESRIL